VTLVEKDERLTKFTDLNADSYDFNNHAYQRFVEKLKVGIPRIPSISILTSSRLQSIPMASSHPANKACGQQSTNTSATPQEKKQTPAL